MIEQFHFNTIQSALASIHYSNRALNTVPGKTLTHAAEELLIRTQAFSWSKRRSTAFEDFYWELFIRRSSIEVKIFATRITRNGETPVLLATYRLTKPYPSKLKLTQLT